MTPETPEEWKVRGAEAVLIVLFESLTRGYSFGRVVERFREVARVPDGSVVGLWERLQMSGGLSINNALFAEYEACERKDSP